MTTPRSISWLTSNKGKRLLIIDGFVFQSNKVLTKVTYWKCEIKECGATAHTDSNDQLVKERGTHTHLPSPERNEIRSLKKAAKDRVKVEAISVTQIYEEELAHAQLSTTALATAPSGNEASKCFLIFLLVSIIHLGYALNRIRREDVPLLPTSIQFEIPDTYSKSWEGENFLVADTINRKKRTLVFATDDQLRLLFKSEHILMDGTFDACPPFFNQIYSLHAIKQGQSKRLLKNILVSSFYRFCLCYRTALWTHGKDL
jgi:hypothetical protein